MATALLQDRLSASLSERWSWGMEVGMGDLHRVLISHGVVKSSPEACQGWRIHFVFLVP